jgi:hypothetical protein
MLALKESCRLPNSNYAYIESISGGRDNSIESLQVGYVLSLLQLLSPQPAWLVICTYRPSHAIC